MINVVARWLELIGFPARANSLLVPWQGDPAVVLLGLRQAELAYANPSYRPALDSWDCGLTTRRDLKIWSEHIAAGHYHGTSIMRFRSAMVAIEVDDWAGLPEQTQQSLSRRWLPTESEGQPLGLQLAAPAMLHLWLR